MSTPRRPAPRSRLAPIRATGRWSVCALTQRKLPLHEMSATERQGIRVLLADDDRALRSEEHTSELQSQSNLVCRLLLEKQQSMCFLPSSAQPDLDLYLPYSAPPLERAPGMVGELSAVPPHAVTDRTARVPLRTDSSRAD